MTSFFLRLIRSKVKDTLYDVTEESLIRRSAIRHAVGFFRLFIYSRLLYASLQPPLHQYIANVCVGGKCVEPFGAFGKGRELINLPILLSELYLKCELLWGYSVCDMCVLVGANLYICFCCCCSSSSLCDHENF